MKAKRLLNVFLYGSVPKEEYARIRPQIWRRNKKILQITSLMSILMGAGFLAFALIARSGTWLPYLILLCGSLLVILINEFTKKIENELLGICLCYGQMALVCVYAGLLSVQTSNYALPATSIVVFIALLPLSIDDILVRMFSFMGCESAAYLTVSYFFKSPEAYRLDVMNVATFFVVGMVLYGVISTRNVREIYQGVRIEKIQHSIISSMATVVEERDENTGEHILRTEDYVRALVEKMKQSGRYARYGEDYFHSIVLAAPMHDIGKIKIPDAILNKPGRLTPEEFGVMKKHAEYGAGIIRKTMKDVEDNHYFDVALNIARHHHERYDGGGYPDGLKGEEIPLEARVMALADVYDALISKRVYKEAFPKEEAVRIMKEGAGSQFDPALVPLFLECI